MINNSTYNLYYSNHELKIIGHGEFNICAIISCLTNFLIFFKTNQDIILLKSKGYIYIKAYSSLLQKQIFHIVKYLQHMNNNTQHIIFHF